MRTAKEELIRQLQCKVERAEETRQELVTKMSDLENALYMIKWMSETPREIMDGLMAQEALHYFEVELKDKPFETAAELVINQFTEALNRWSPERSTSPWSNEVNQQWYKALKRFVEFLNNEVK